MAWSKLGLIFSPNSENDWMLKYASYPWAEHLNGDYFKIYFSCRNSKNFSHIGFIVIDINDPSNILEVSKKPVLEPGQIGTFDDCGVSMSCLLKVNDTRYLYYLGWNVLVRVPWKNTIGLAIFDDKLGSFVRYSQAPVLGIHHSDPFTLTYPFVMFDQGIFKMWYGSSLFWGEKVEDTLHVIKYAESIDGINWDRKNQVCLEPLKGREFALVKPFVIKEDNLYKMWFSYREGMKYDIGYAESSDGINWVRNFESTLLTKSHHGWDSEMVCYPYLFEHNSQKYMLYNGNGFGKTGIGLAIWEK